MPAAATNPILTQSAPEDSQQGDNLAPLGFFRRYLRRLASDAALLCSVPESRGLVGGCGGPPWNQVHAGPPWNEVRAGHHQKTSWVAPATAAIPVQSIRRLT